MTVLTHIGSHIVAFAGKTTTVEITYDFPTTIEGDVNHDEPQQLYQHSGSQRGHGQVQDGSGF